MRTEQSEDQIRQKKEKALNQVHERYYDRLLRLATVIVKSDATAEDLLGDVFLNLWERDFDFNSPRGAADVKSYLFTCLRNACIDELERIGRQTQADQAYTNIYLKNDSLLEGQFIRTQTLDRMMELTAMLPPNLLEVWLWVYVEGKKPGEAARILDIPKNDMYMRHKKLKKLLKKKVQPEFIGLLLSLSLLLSNIYLN